MADTDAKRPLYVRYPATAVILFNMALWLAVVTTFRWMMGPARMMAVGSAITLASVWSMGVQSLKDAFERQEGEMRS